MKELWRIATILYRRPHQRPRQWPRAKARRPRLTQLSRAERELIAAMRHRGIVGDA